MKIEELIEKVECDNIFQEFCLEVIELNLKDIQKSESEISIQNMKDDTIFRLKELGVEFDEEEIEW